MYRVDAGGQGMGQGRPNKDQSEKDFLAPFDSNHDSNLMLHGLRRLTSPPQTHSFDDSAGLHAPHRWHAPLNFPSIAALLKEAPLAS